MPTLLTDPDVEPSTAEGKALIERLPAGEPLFVHRLHMVDSQHGWATMEAGNRIWHVLRTQDGGKSWADVSPPIHISEERGPAWVTGTFPDAQKAWVVYSPYDPDTGPMGQLTVWRTGDGGRTWEPSWRRLGTGQEGETSFPRLDFIDDQMGWMHIDTFLGAGSYGNDLFRTSDGGLRWELVPLRSHSGASPASGIVQALEFKNPEQGWIVSDHPVAMGIWIHWTSDRGDSWRTAELPPPPGTPDLFRDHTCTPRASALFAPSHGMLWIACQSVDVDYLYATNDAGLTWLTKPFPNSFFRRDVEIVSPSSVFVLGYGPPTADGDPPAVELFRSFDGGGTWSQMTRFENPGQVEFVNDNEGWFIPASQETGSLSVTADGGATWRQLSPQTIASEPLNPAQATVSISLPENRGTLNPDNLKDIQLVAELMIDNPTSLAFTARGDELLTAQGNGWLTSWDLSGTERPQVVHKHQDWVYEVEFGLANPPFVSASKDGSIWVWWHPSAYHYPIFVQDGEATSIAIFPDGFRVAVGSENAMVKLWDVAEFTEDYTEGVLLGTLEGHDNWVWDVAISPDGHTLASASADRTIRLWDSETGELIHNLVGHQGTIRALAFSPSGQILASGSWDGMVKLWDVTAGNELLSLADHHAPIDALVYSPDGTLLCSGDAQGTIICWDPRSGAPLHTFSGGSGRISDLAISPEGNLLATTLDRGSVLFWAVLEP